MHNEDDGSSVGVGNTTSHNNWMLLHDMVIYSFNVNVASIRVLFNYMAIISSNTTICTMIYEGFSIVGVSRCGDMVSSQSGSEVCVIGRENGHHVHAVGDTINGDIARLWHGICLLCRVPCPLMSSSFLSAIIHRMSAGGREEPLGGFQCQCFSLFTSV